MKNLRQAILSGPLTTENYEDYCLFFGDRQAGISHVYCPDENSFLYCVYCVETKILKDLFSVECEYLEEALELVNEEFGSWELVAYNKKNKSSCSTCVAK